MHRAPARRDRGIESAGPEVRVWKRLRDDEVVYGFGEKTGRLNKRGWGLGGYHYTMWNTDTYGYDSSTDPLYVSVPFFIVMRDGKAHGIFLDNTFRSTFDVGREGGSLLSFGAEGGELDYYFAGIWNDMNEPAVWIHPADTTPLDVRHDGEGQPTDHREAHNVYGLLNSRSTFEGLSRLRPDARPFVLTRSSLAGGQRYAAVWPGDNTADWSSLRQSLPTLMGLGFSGFSFVGADIGGFAHYPSAELFTRWIQAAVFSPFMRAHTEAATPDQDPWSFGARHEPVNRCAIKLRYELLAPASTT